MLNYIILIVGLIFVVPQANANTYHYHKGMSLCENDRLGLENNDDTLLRFLWWDGAAVGEEEGAVDSDWSSMRCHSEDDNVFVVVKIDEWPPTLPTNNMATCVATAENDDVHYLHIHFDLVDEEDLFCYPLVEGWGSNGTTLKMVEGQAIYFKAPLVVENEYELGTYGGKKANGDPWSGVSCVVSEDGNDLALMKVTITNSAEEEDGYCPVPDDESAGVFKVPVTLELVSP